LLDSESHNGTEDRERPTLGQVEQVVIVPNALLEQPEFCEENLLAKLE
jgi:hypothetical protein